MWNIKKLAGNIKNTALNMAKDLVDVENENDQQTQLHQSKEDQKTKDQIEDLIIQNESNSNSEKQNKIQIEKKDWEVEAEEKFKNIGIVIETFQSQTAIDLESSFKIVKEKLYSLEIQDDIIQELQLIEENNLKLKEQNEIIMLQFKEISTIFKQYEQQSKQNQKLISHYEEKLLSQSNQINELMIQNENIASELQNQNKQQNSFKNIAASHVQKLIQETNSLIQSHIENHILLSDSQSIENINLVFENLHKNTDFEFQAFFNNLAISSKQLLQQIFINFDKSKRKIESEKEKLQELLNQSNQDNKQQKIELDNNQKKLLEYQDKLYIQKQSLESQNFKTKDQEKIIQEYESSLKNAQEEYKQKNQEIEQLKNKIKLEQQDNNNLKNKIIQLEQTLKLQSELNLEREKLQQQIEQLLTEQNEKNFQIESLQQSLHNLNSLIEDEQHRKEQISRKYDQELKKMRIEIDEYKKKNEDSASLKIKLNSSEQKLIDQSLVIKDLENRLQNLQKIENEFKQEVKVLLDKVKNDSLNRENMVDKRIISNFILNYFDSQTSFDVKIQILETLSSVLTFNEEQKNQLGLHKLKLKELQQTRKSEQRPAGDQSIRQQLMNFLMEEDDN